MKKSESKYFNTAVRMDRAFLELLEKKDMEYITVKEISEAAGVNRSTFYLHYETIDDLLAESVQYMNQQFQEHMKLGAEKFVSKIRECPLEELYLVTPTYLLPYIPGLPPAPETVPKWEEIHGASFACKFRPSEGSRNFLMLYGTGVYSAGYIPDTGP